MFVSHRSAFETKRNQLLIKRLCNPMGWMKKVAMTLWLMHTAHAIGEMEWKILFANYRPFGTQVRIQINWICLDSQMSLLVISMYAWILTGCVDRVYCRQNETGLDCTKCCNRKFGNVWQTNGNHFTDVQIEICVQTDCKCRRMISQLRICVPPSGYSAFLKGNKK